MRLTLLLLTSLICHCTIEASTVLITGASSGIGLASAQAFVKAGWSVWGVSRTISQHSQTNLKGIQFRYMDVTDDQSVASVIDEIIATDGRLDVLINNAGYGLIGGVEGVTIEEAKAQFEVNFFGALRLCQAVMPYMRQARQGHIINISSTAGIRALPGLGIYSASKFALEGLTEALAAEGSLWNIKVSLAEPGGVANAWANNCTVGTRQTDTVYHKLQDTLKERLILGAPTGQSCDQIGQLIVEIAQCENPDLRYQTSFRAYQIAAKKFTDPSGNMLRDEQLTFLRLLIPEL